jgi:hypothetical protein
MSPESQSVNQISIHMVRRKHQEMWENGTWPLYDDKMCLHTALYVVGYLAKHNIPEVPNPLMFPWFGPM